MIDGPVLLDTCAVLWLGEDEPISPEAVKALNETIARGEPILVSPFSAWEIGLLASRGRLGLSLSPERWFARFMRRGGIRLAELSPDILVGASFLPGLPPSDPADRILASTARSLGAPLMTRDGKLLAYAAAGHMHAIAC